MSKVAIEIEYLLKTSAHILYNCMSTPSGLEEWFAPEVHIKGEVFTFLWEGEERSAKLEELYELEMLGRELGLISGGMVGRKPVKT